MRPGMGSPSYVETATFAAITGTFDADYPVGNLADLLEPSNPARVSTSAGAAAFSAVLAADQTIQFAALVNHTLPAGATVQMRFYSDTGLSVLVEDTTATAIPDPVTGYAQVFPVVLSAPSTIRSVRVDIAGASASLDIGGMEISGWWEWPRITSGAEVGFKASGEEAELVGGGSTGAEGWMARTYSGTVSYQDWSESETGIDFQKTQGLTRPFVFVEDYSDPNSWLRTCFLAVNSDLPPMVAQLYGLDNFQFRLSEHDR